jgi:hypothetical protein
MANPPLRSTSIPGADAPLPLTSDTAPAAAKGGRSWLGILLGLLIGGAIIGGIGVGVYGIIRGQRGVDRAAQISDKKLSSRDRSALGISGNEQMLFDGRAPAALTAAFETAIAGEPTGFTSIALYSDYAMATAQEPAKPDHLDQFQWRLGKVGAPSPQANDADAPAKAFNVGDVDWAAISALIADAPRLSAVEEGVVSHVVVERNQSFEPWVINVRIFVSGPRSSAVIEAGADGTVLRTR